MEKGCVCSRQRLPSLFPNEAVCCNRLRRGLWWDSPWCFPVQNWAAQSLHKAVWTVLLPLREWDLFSLQTQWAGTLAFPARPNSMTAPAVAYWGTAFLKEVLSYHLRCLCAKPKGKLPALLLPGLHRCNATSHLSWWKQPFTKYLFSTFIIWKRLAACGFLITGVGLYRGHLLMQTGHLLKVSGQCCS